MKTTINISTKAIFVVLGIIILVGLGYFAYSKIFAGQSVVGKTYVSVPKVSNPKVESIIFTKDGTLMGETYSFETEKWSSVPFSGKYEFQDDKIYFSGLGGLANMSATFKWIGKDKFETIDNNSDTTVYVLKGSDEDVSRMNTLSLSGVYVLINSTSTEYPFFSIEYTDEGGIEIQKYSKKAKRWEFSQKYDSYMCRENLITIPGVQQYRIYWLSKEKYFSKDGDDIFIYVKKGSKEDTSPK